MYTYKINSYEARTDSLVPMVACDVMAFDGDGNMLKHETVIVEAGEIDAQLKSKDSLDKIQLAIVEKSPNFNVELLDAIVAEKESKIKATKDAQVVVDKLNEVVSIAVATAKNGKKEAVTEVMKEHIKK